MPRYYTKKSPSFEDGYDAGWRTWQHQKVVAPSLSGRSLMLYRKGFQKGFGDGKKFIGPISVFTGRRIGQPKKRKNTRTRSRR